MAIAATTAQQATLGIFGSTLLHGDGQKIDLKTSHLNKNQNKMIIGEVVGVHIDNKFIKNNKINSLSMNVISRMGYSEYTKVSSNFLMKRPEWIEK